MKPFFNKVIKEIELLSQIVYDWITGFNFKKYLSYRTIQYLKTGLWILLILFILVFIIPVVQEVTIRIYYHKPGDIDSTEIKKVNKQIKTAENSIRRLENKIAALTPKSCYLIINTTENEFYLYKNKKLVRQGNCSTGSYIMLKDGNEQKWMFKTPKGLFRIQGKTTSPVWKKPDWAFIEEGLPVPPQNHYSRYEYGVLGDYALSLGHGYLIHGTLYKRFLGLPVTHGCIRLNDEDLATIYQSMNIGSKVFIY